MKKLTVQQALTRAEAYLKKGDLDSARELYVDIIRRFPGNNKAVFGLAQLDRTQHDQPVDHEQLKKAIAFLGTLHNAGRHAELAKATERFIQKHPASFELWTILGGARNSLGQATEAEKCFRKVIELKPDYAEAHSNLGVVLESMGRLDDAILAHRSALKVNPQFYVAHFNIGNVYKDTGRLEDAVSSYREAVTIMPFFAQAYINLGIVLVDLYRLDEAVSAYQYALTLEPENASAYNNLGLAFTEKGLLDDAIAAYQRALVFKPDYADAYFNIGNALKDKSKFDDAIAAYQRALAHKPDYTEAYNNMGNALKDQGKLDEAIATYERALALKPDYANAYYNMGRALWKMCEFGKASPYLEWRWKADKHIGKSIKSTKPIWKKCNSNRVLLWPEQGIGDQIMFCSVLNELHKNCRSLSVSCDSRLIPIFERSFPKGILYYPSSQKIEEDCYDSYIPMGSLPFMLRKSLDDFKGKSGAFLTSDKLKSLALREMIKGAGSARVVGLSWKTNSSRSDAQKRGIDLVQILGALNSNRLELVNLQYGEVDKEIDQAAIKTGKRIHKFENIDKMNDLDGLAALIYACDYVVSIDNVTVHLAGSLGVATKALLPNVADERWAVNSDSSYWYESVKLYRQCEPGNWQHPLEKIRIEILNDIKKDSSPFA
jgi:tetratricopeptide (TPR) repeat protein